MANEKLNAVRKIDELGRIVLPTELMKMMGWDKRDSLLLTFDKENGEATLKISEKYPGPKCVFCGASESKLSKNGKDICGDCIDGIKSI